MQRFNVELGRDEVLKLINICNHAINTNYKTVKEDSTTFISNSESIKIIEIRNRLKQCIAK